MSEVEVLKAWLHSVACMTCGYLLILTDCIFNIEWTVLSSFLIGHPSSSHHETGVMIHWGVDFSLWPAPISSALADQRQTESRAKISVAP